MVSWSSSASPGMSTVVSHLFWYKHLSALVQYQYRYWNLEFTNTVSVLFSDACWQSITQLQSPSGDFLQKKAFSSEDLTYSVPWFWTNFWTSELPNIILPLSFIIIQTLLKLIFSSSESTQLWIWNRVFLYRQVHSTFTWDWRSK